MKNVQAALLLGYPPELHYKAGISHDHESLFLLSTKVICKEEGHAVVSSC